MGKRKTMEEKKLGEWKKMEKKFLGKIRKDKKKNNGKEVKREQVKCFKCQEKGHFMNNCKREWVKRKIISQKKKGKEQYLNCMGKNVQENNGGIGNNVQENSNGRTETMLGEMIVNNNSDEEMLEDS